MAMSETILEVNDENFAEEVENREGLSRRGVALAAWWRPSSRSLPRSTGRRA
jgi:hypothetical protein